ncbi:MAG: 3-hydroxyacyl-ACP dehydratase FabZ family protein [Planctomycetia bacterium]|nr:3-hydroxyacyl-ACP dehydratase FabZ family protein [Planctomycetia bacterium]
MPNSDITNAIPHRPPFLFVDDILSLEEKKIVCVKKFSGEEDFFKGHYPDFPLVPGVILCEAALQSGAIYLSKTFEEAPSQGENLRNPLQGKMPVVAKMSDIRFKQVVRPGDSIQIETSLVDHVANAYSMASVVTTQGKIAAKLTFVVMLVDAQKSA